MTDRCCLAGRRPRPTSPPLSHLQHLERVVELCLAGAGGGRHGDGGGDGGDAPAELVGGRHAELVAVRGAQVVDDEVLVLYVVRQVHPVDVGVWREK